LTVERLFNRTLNMRSTRDVIADAALACVARDGFGVSLRTVAAEAGVSAALIVHHFGSKQGLLEALEDRVLGIAEEKLRLMEDDGPGAAMAYVVSLMSDGAAPRYLARVLTEGGDPARRLFTAFVDVTEKGIASLSLAEPRVTAGLLVTHALGLMIMADRVADATGVHPYQGEEIHRVLVAALDVYGGKLLPLLPS
jgi:AcrR family transcriptional regulator